MLNSTCGGSWEATIAESNSEIKSRLQELQRLNTAGAQPLEGHNTSTHGLGPLPPRPCRDGRVPAAARRDRRRLGPPQAGLADAGAPPGSCGAESQPPGDGGGVRRRLSPDERWQRREQRREQRRWVPIRRPFGRVPLLGAPVDRAGPDVRTVHRTCSFPRVVGASLVVTRPVVRASRRQPAAAAGRRRPGQVAARVGRDAGAGCPRSGGAGVALALALAALVHDDRRRAGWTGRGGGAAAPAPAAASPAAATAASRAAWQPLRLGWRRRRRGVAGQAGFAVDRGVPWRQGRGRWRG